MAVLKAKVGTEWVEVGTPVVPVDQMRWRGVGSSLPAMSSIRKGDVIEYYWGYWLWRYDTPPTAWPLTSQPWLLMGREPYITEGQMNAWTSAQTGDQAWVIPSAGTQPAAVGQRLMIRTTAGPWAYADSGKEAITTSAVYATGFSQGVVIPATQYTLMAPAMVKINVSVYLARLSGAGQMELRIEGGGNPPSGAQLPLIRHHMDGTNPDAVLTGAWTAFQPNTGLQGIQAVVFRTSGDVIAECYTDLYRMTISW